MEVAIVDALFRKICRTPRKISPIWPFHKKISRISDDRFFVIHHKFGILPLFLCFNSFPLFRDFFFSPTFANWPPWFRKVYVFFTYFTCISFPSTFTMMHLCITQCTYWTPRFIPSNFRMTLVYTFRRLVRGATGQSQVWNMTHIY